MDKVRAFALLGLAGVLPGCSLEKAPALARLQAPIVGRVLATEQIGVFEGDVELQWYSHTVEPRESPGARLTIVGDTAACPAPGNDHQFYRFEIARRPLPFALRRETDRSLMSDLVITSCAPVD